MMKILFIGTGSAKRSLNREYSSFLVISDDYNLLVDCGDGITRGLLKQNIGTEELDGLLITHFHPDHITGLPALLVQMKMENRAKKLDIFIRENLQSRLEELLNTTYLFRSRLNFEIVYKPIEIDKELFISKQISIFCRENTHLEGYKSSPESNKYQLSCISILFNLDGTMVFYTGDIGGKEDLELFNAHRTDMIISESTHVGIDSIFNYAEANLIPLVFLTHLSEGQEVMVEDAAKTRGIEDKVTAAFDGMEIDCAR